MNALQPPKIRLLLSQHLRTAAALVCVCVGLCPARAQTPLRYDFEPGQRLVYERRVRVLPLDNDALLENWREQIQFWCLSDDLSEDFLLAEALRADDGKPAAARLAAFHIDHRGDRRFMPAMLDRLADGDPILELLPVLPSTLENNATWLTPPDHYGRQWSCRRAPDAGDGFIRLEFELSDPTGVATLLKQSQRGILTYDPRLECIRRLETDMTDSIAGRRTQAVAVLLSRLETPELWRRQRLLEWDKVQRALRQHDRLIDRLWNDPDRPAQVSAEIERIWSEIDAELMGTQDNPFQRYARAQLDLARRNRPRVREQGNLAGRWLGVKAAQWSLQTPDGQTLASEPLRDRYVLECFWSVSSVDSLRTFEALRRLAATLPLERVRVVCLNIDSDVVAARRAIELCGGGLTHVLAGAPLDGAPPRDLPVCRLLAPDSRILGVYFGWQPNLAEYIAGRIRQNITLRRAAPEEAGRIPRNMEPPS